MASRSSTRLASFFSADRMSALVSTMKAWSFSVSGTRAQAMRSASPNAWLHQSAMSVRRVAQSIAAVSSPALPSVTTSRSEMRCRMSIGISTRR